MNDKEHKVYPGLVQIGLHPTMVVFLKNLNPELQAQESLSRDYNLSQAHSQLQDSFSQEIASLKLSFTLFLSQI